jgi:hypothetical protein
MYFNPKKIMQASQILQCKFLAELVQQVFHGLLARTSYDNIIHVYQDKHCYIIVMKIE